MLGDHSALHDNTARRTLSRKPADIDIQTFQNIVANVMREGMDNDINVAADNASNEFYRCAEKSRISDHVVKYSANNSGK